MKRAVILIGLLGAGAAGCAHQHYEYLPTEEAKVSVAGRPAAVYQLPGGTGQVSIATVGLAAVHQAGGASLTAMHVRMEVVNRSAGPMTLDTREQVATLDGYGDAVPTLHGIQGDSTGTESSLVTVPPGQARTVELFYAVPEAVIGTQLVPRVDVAWSVQTQAGPMRARAAFDRRVF